MEHKRGDSFDYFIEIPLDFPDGYFGEWGVSAQLRDQENDTLVAQLDAQWADPVTTRRLDLKKLNTRSWPLTSCEFDVQFVRTVDSYTMSTNTVVVEIVKDVTV